MQVVSIFGALADISRLRILQLVRTMELAVGEIAQVLGQSQPRVSRHIGILCDAGLAERRREGSWIFLRAVPASDANLAGGVVALLARAEEAQSDFAAICAEDRGRLAAIRAAREDEAQTYFAQHADTWDELRRLHSSDTLVEEALVASLADEPLGVVLDVGTGTGRIAELLSEAATKVIALDKSPSMLRLARARLQKLGSKPIEMVQGDFGNLPLAPQSVDTVLFHQVLHFAQDPAPAVGEAARVTRPGGRIAIVDFAAHQREELRERYAHARLGFSDDQIHLALERAGFAPLATQTLKEGELAVKIWTGRRKDQHS